MRLLAINFGGIGDEILFLPTLRSIRLAHPDWQITLLTEPRSRSITQLTRLIDENIVFDIKKTPLKPADYFELIGLLQNGKYDIVLSSGSSTKVCLLLFLSGIKVKVGYDSGFLSRLLLNKAIKLNREQYASYMYEDLVGGLDIAPSYSAPQIDLCPQALEKMRSFLAEFRQSKAIAGTVPKRRPLVLIHPGTSLMALQKGIIKTWSCHNWSELIKRLLSLDCEVLLCGGPDDDDTIRDITQNLNDLQSQERGLLINAYGKTSSIKDLAALMQLSDLIVCVDSAPMHIAAALQKRLVALFGPTDPKKLLLTGENAQAIQEEESARKQAKTETCVQIPLDIVFRTATDQLNRASVQENFQVCRPS